MESREKRKARLRRYSGFRPSRFQVSDVRGLSRGQGWVDLRLPDTLDLVGRFEETTEFVNTIRYTAITQRRRVRLLFDQVKTIRPAALLLLLAQIHECRLVFGPRHVTGTYPEDPKLERMMHATGFFALLGVVSRVEAKARRRGSVEYIEFISGERMERGAAKELRESLLGESVSMNIVARKKLFRAISEAMLNVGQHAYPDGTRYTNRARGRWWLMGTVDRRRNELMIAFCDLGVGIPSTLPKLYTWELIRAALALLPGIKPNDAQMIQAAMTIGRTQTGATSRGKGLNDLRRFIDESGSGKLHLASRHGLYTYNAGGAEKVQNYSYSNGGTIIKWSVPLDKVTNWTGEVDDGDGEYEDD